MVEYFKALRRLCKVKKLVLELTTTRHYGMYQGDSSTDYSCSKGNGIIYPIFVLHLEAKRRRDFLTQTVELMQNMSRELN